MAMAMNQVLADLQQFKRHGLDVRCNEFASPSGPYDPITGRPLTSRRTQTGLRALAPRDPNKIDIGRTKVRFAVPDCSGAKSGTTSASLALQKDGIPQESEKDDGEAALSRKIGATESSVAVQPQQEPIQAQSQQVQDTEKQAREPNTAEKASCKTAGKPVGNRSSAAAKEEAEGGEHAQLAQEAVKVEMQEAYDKAQAQYRGQELLAAQLKKHEDELNARSASAKEGSLNLGATVAESSADGGEGEPSEENVGLKFQRVKNKMLSVSALRCPRTGPLVTGVDFSWSLALQKPPGTRSKLEIAKACEGIRKLRHPFFASFSDDALARLVKEVEHESYAAEECIFSEGEFGTEFFLVLSGGVSVFRKDRSIASARAAHSHRSSIEVRLTHLNDLYPGDGFGELALLSQKAGSSARTATVVATDDTEVLVVRRLLFNRVKRAQKEKELSDRIDFCRKLPHMSHLSREATIDMAAAMKLKSYPRKTVIVEQDAVPTHVFFLVAGQISLVWAQRGAPTKGRRGCPPVDISGIAPRCMFGECGAFGGGASMVSYVAQTEVTVYIVKNADFDRLVTQSTRSALLEDMQGKSTVLNKKIAEVLKVRNVPLQSVRAVLRSNAQDRACAKASVRAAGAGAVTRSRSPSKGQSSSPEAGEEGPVLESVDKNRELRVPQGFISRADSQDLPRVGRPRYRVAERPWKVLSQVKLPDGVEMGEILSTHLHRRRLGIPPPVVMRRNYSEVGRHADETAIRANPQVTFS